jgi:hypothetical protein
VMPTPLRALPREIGHGIFWIGDCLRRESATAPFHLHSSAFLIIGDSQTLLIDTGHPGHWATIESMLNQILGDRALDWIMPTHPEPAHAGNLSRLLHKYPTARVPGDIRDYHVFWPDISSRLVPMHSGDTLDLGGGVRVDVLPALIRDLPNTQWAFEHSQRVLFVSDGFAYSHQSIAEESDESGPIHRPGSCALLTSEIPDPPTVEEALLATRSALSWSRFVKIDEMFIQFVHLLDHLDVALVAPAHGNVISERDPILQVMRLAYDKAYDPSPVV